ncbi:hypothetical protein [Lentzea sp. NPDC051838]|uniref:hypothetical protein n=1 Tax=Lentzea sp. NPDC051838 TaxID=3154849 RepID=UPI003442263E
MGAAKFVGGLVIVAGVVGGIAALTGPVRDWFTDRTDTSSLAAEPANKPQVTHFALPLDVPFEQMPFASTNVCGGDQVEWLRRFGTEIPRNQGIAIRNSADDGAMLTIDNIRAVDVETTKAQPSVHFECPDQGNGEFVALELRLDRDLKAYEKAEGQSRPFAFNLEPGETGNVLVQLKADGDNAYSGRLVADVRTGDSKETVSLPLNGEDRNRFEWRKFGKYGRLVVQPGTAKGLFWCNLYPTEDTPYGVDMDSFECSPEKIRSVLDEIGRS